MCELEPLVAHIRRSRKYRYLCEDTIRDILAQETARHQSPAKALDAAKKRLHRVWAAYLGEPDYPKAARALEQAFVSGQDGDIRAACTRVMAAHASSRERLGILSELFAAIFAVTGTPASLADLACALDPLAFRWMRLPRTVAYTAYDINTRTVDLVAHYFRLEGLEQRAELRDVLCNPAQGPSDVAFLFKMYHCLEHRQRGAGWTVVESTPAQWVVVSFPTRNLSGRPVDIARNYEPDIQRRAADRGWVCRRIEFEPEILFLIGKSLYGKA